jgi:hypothetical protein
MALTSRQQQLTNLAGNIPGQNEDLLKQQQATQQIQMQQALGQMSQAGQGGKQAAQGIGQKAAQASGQAQVAAAGQTLQQQGQVAGMQQQEQQEAARQDLRSRMNASKVRQTSLANQLAKTNQSLKQDLFDKQNQFQRDELGRTFWNDRQLADWKISQATSDEDLMNYEEQVRQESSKKMAMLEAANRAIQQKKQQAFASGELAQNQALAQELAQAERDVADKMRKAQEKASRNAMILGAAGSIIGAGVGAVVGGPAGAAIGMQVGGGLGQVAAGKGAKAPGV